MAQTRGRHYGTNPNIGENYNDAKVFPITLNNKDVMAVFPLAAAPGPEGAAWRRSGMGRKGPGFGTMAGRRGFPVLPPGIRV